MDFRYALILLSAFILFFLSNQVSSLNENKDDDQSSKRELIAKLKSQTSSKKAISLTKKSDQFRETKSLKNTFSTTKDNLLIAEESSTTSPIPLKKLDVVDNDDEEKVLKTIYENDRLNETHFINDSYFEAYYYDDPEKAMNYWVDVKSFNDSQFVHEVLSNSHRRAASISLPFNFLFYGNNLTKITVATGGFLYMGDHIHSWLAATQYIAPLMANFDTSNSTRSQILYGYNSSMFLIQWENVMLHENRSLEFTFQCAIKPNGDIIFVYKDIPIKIEDIPDTNHPVKIGVSDAYFISRNHLFVRRKTIYEYHKFDFLKEKNFAIKSKTALYLKAAITCNSYKNCNECLTQNTKFKCTWCESIKRCSEGYDRSRQDWVHNQCDSKAVSSVDKCSAIVPTEQIPMTSKNYSETHLTPSPTLPQNNISNNSSSTSTTNIFNDHSLDNIDIKHNDKNLTNLEYNTQEQKSGLAMKNKKNQAANSSLTISFFFVISIILGVSLWIFYAYRNPTSSSGQFLIRWRPSNWRWNGGETRYTVASIHM
ncbi:Plexin domain-containing protein 2 [Sarcoptes scabiei]|uniref:Plexin domain-containing protein 2 n=1 Tax=Sarcoptes scabiei TaxID=52283 RepID=A0A834RD97_SARSC|nr:Plexin domain-containing protein 2 [Sarcoptes scabiei]UXI21767.1 hypothetical protein NH340_JMT07710 [Sarcoptes scabiei]